MRKRSMLTIALAVALGASASPSPAPPLEIRLANGTEREVETRDALERIVTEYDIERWTFTHEVVIDENAIPHSHPVLTIHTRHLGDDHALLAVFLHEQFHWLEEEMGDARERAIEEFQERFPDAPSGRPLGGRDVRSTYLHLVVCDLEYQAMTLLVGEAEARETLRENTHYEWIYETVLEDPAVREINLRHGLDVNSIDG